jgi:LuxR family transcriptional regulator
MYESRRLMVRYLDRLDVLAPVGYTAGLRIRFASPLYLRSTYPQAWREHYVAKGYAARDPISFWGISRAGTARWSEIPLPDPFGVMRQAARHGLIFGVVVSCGQVANRSIVGAARSDREFTDPEIAEVEEVAHGLHDVVEPLDDLPPELIEALRLAGDGGDLTAAAVAHGMTEGELEARLSSARDLLGVGTTAEAARMAREFRLI